jgi:hypothetical protein
VAAGPPGLIRRVGHPARHARPHAGSDRNVHDRYPDHHPEQRCPVQGTEDAAAGTAENIDTTSTEAAADGTADPAVTDGVEATSVSIDTALGVDSRGGVSRPNLQIELSNRRGALATTADVYQLGLVDARRDATVKGEPGIDLRALGVQSSDLGTAGDKLLVFAMNSYDRYSNAARNQSQVLIDRNNDGNPEYIVYAVDSGLVRSGSADGRNEVFIYDTATQGDHRRRLHGVLPHRQQHHVAAGEGEQPGHHQGDGHVQLHRRDLVGGQRVGDRRLRGHGQVQPVDSRHRERAVRVAEEGRPQRQGSRQGRCGSLRGPASPRESWWS